MLNFSQIMRLAKQRVGSRKALAVALGVTPARITRVCSGDDYALNIENCLKLAHVTGLKPSEILTAAGKGDIAKLIESLYGEARNDEQIASYVARTFKLKVGYCRLAVACIKAIVDDDPIAIGHLFSYLPEEDRQGIVDILPLLRTTLDSHSQAADTGRPRSNPRQARARQPGLLDGSVAVPRRRAAS